MELSEEKLEAILSRQADRASRESEVRMAKLMDQRFSNFSKESDERMERYIGTLKEDL